MRSLADVRSQRCGMVLSLSEDHIQSILIVRRARRRLFGEDLFTDPAWDILLELFVAHLAEREVALAELARAIDVPLSTTSRWLTALREKGLVISDDSAGRARSRAKLTHEGAEKLRSLGDRWGSAFLSI